VAFSWSKQRNRRIPDDLWVRCPACDATVFNKDLDERLKTCPKCAFHFPISSHLRIAYTLDPGSWRELDGAMETVDALGFQDRMPYPRKLAESAGSTGVKEAMRYGTGTVEGRPVVFGTLEFRFLGGSMGVVVGEKVTRAVELARDRALPLVLVSASGGARMHEGILSLMQMAKTCAAISQLREAGGFYVSLCTHPTTGGVTASWAMAADVIMAEPGALIGFAGPRVIEGTIKKKLPPGFQTAEFLLEKGQIDMLVPRQELRSTLARLLGYGARQPGAGVAKEAGGS
jgi:acetyl-CoA carboxylase carboxyl transferase subunit beta